MRTTLVDFEMRPLDVELAQPFGIATGAEHVAENVAVRVTLEDGTQGLGEAAPFPAATGHTQMDAMAALTRIRDVLLGSDVRCWRELANHARIAAQGIHSALCAAETAMLDALTRSGRLPLWSFFGGAERHLTSDITVVTGTVESAERSSRLAVKQGFHVLKVKVGGADLAHDVGRILAITGAAPQARLILDANASLTDQLALDLLRELGSLRERVVLFEQPTPHDDLAGMRRVFANGAVPVAADESARTREDVIKIAEAQAAQVINIKIMKSGIAQALDMIGAAKGLGLSLMIGGMVETKIAMTTSACLAAGIGGFAHVDLDTPLFFKRQPTRGGYEQRGDELDLTRVEHGHGVGLLE